jgi:hypothetical protein
MSVFLSRRLALSLLLIAGGCKTQQDTQSNAAPEIAESAAANADEQLPLHEKDAAGAVRVVERAIGLATNGRLQAIRPLLALPGDIDEQVSGARKAFEDHREVRIVISGKGQTEGAAGSPYMTIPVTVSYLDAKDKAVNRAATVTLRRVNDVPDATEEERSWRIVDAKFDPPAK